MVGEKVALVVRGRLFIFDLKVVNGSDVTFLS